MRPRIIGWFLILLSLGVLLILLKMSLRLPAKTLVILPAPPDLKRKSVTLDDGEVTYHLNIAIFQKEFPHLQNYQCSLLYTPRPEDRGASPLLLLAIKSHPASVSRRWALRRTWAKGVEVMGYTVRPIFLMALSGHDKQMAMVKVEKEEYEDILLWDFTEEHHNLSLKERCFLEWLYHNPRQADFIFKGDDDVFVNPASLVQYIKVHASSSSTLHGSLQKDAVVFRFGKYRVLKTVFPYSNYPYFLSGGGFIFPRPTVPLLYHLSLELPVFPLDDVYFGLLSLAGNLTFRDDSRFYVFGLTYNPCDFQRAIMVHGIEPNHLLQIWRPVQEAQCNGAVPNIN